MIVYVRVRVSVCCEFNVDVGIFLTNITCIYRHFTRKNHLQKITHTREPLGSEFVYKIFIGRFVILFHKFSIA